MQPSTTDGIDDDTTVNATVRLRHAAVRLRHAAIGLHHRASVAVTCVTGALGGPGVGVTGRNQKGRGQQTDIDAFHASPCPFPGLPLEAQAS